MHKEHKILVVDDEQYICEIISELFHNYDSLAVTTQVNPQAAIESLAREHFDLVLTDLVIGDCSGLEVLNAALAHHPDIIVILMTGHPTVENAIAALKQGAYDYLVKPFQLDQLRLTIERGLRKLQLSRENVFLKEQLALAKISEAMGSSLNLRSVLEQLLELTINEFNADAASILFAGNSPGSELTLQAIRTKSGVIVDSDFLEGNTSQSAHTIESRKIMVSNVNIESACGGDYIRDGRFKSYLSCPLLAHGKVFGVLNLQRESCFREYSVGELRSLNIIASRAALAISNSKLYADLERAYLSTISAFANAIEARDVYTRGHTERVTFLAELIAKEMGWDEEALFILSMGSLLHDIGKLAVPDTILKKAGSLTTEEIETMRKHPETGARLIEGIDFLIPCLPYILSHHEKWDGGGYPQGLTGEQIPIEGRMLAVVDTFDAIMSNRPYRNAGSIEAAINELKTYSGTQFDAVIVEIFLKALEASREKIEVIYGVAESHEISKKAPA